MQYIYWTIILPTIGISLGLLLGKLENNLTWRQIFHIIHMVCILEPKLKRANKKIKNKERMIKSLTIAKNRES